MKKTSVLIPCAAALLATIALTQQVTADTILTTTAKRDTYVSSGQADTNFGTMGAMMIAVPTAAQPRTEEALFGFNTASIVSSLNAQYGAGQWSISSVTVTLYANFYTNGQQPNNTSFNKISTGDFSLDWLSNDSWSETGVTWNNIANYLPSTSSTNLEENLGTYYYAAGASSFTWSLSLTSDFVNDIINDNNVTFFGTPTADSTVGYLFNTTNNSPAVLTVTATPEPSTYALLLVGTAGLAFLLKRRPSLSRL